MPTVKLSRIEATLADLEYPITTDRAAAALEDTTLLLADGERNLGALIERSGSNRFESVEDLWTELNNVLPREAVGEPYQSEGDA